MRILRQEPLFTIAAGLVLAVLAPHVHAAAAAPLALYAGPAITAAMRLDPRACLNIGDAVSCSAGMLNVLSAQYGGPTLADNAKTALDAAIPGGYIIESPGGQLDATIVLGTVGVAATGNNDTLPAISGNDPNAKIQDGYKTNTNASDNFAATGKTGTVAGNLGTPDGNGLTSAQNTLGTWDVDSSWLSQALTVNGKRRELMIGFDYNQAAGSAGSIDYWALITVRDSGDVSKKINFEIRSPVTSPVPTPPFTPVDQFTTTKTFDSQPVASDFGTVQTKTCYKLTGGIVTDVYTIATGSCAAGFLDVNNATGSGTAEIIAFLPELNANLETYIGQGYDTISVRMLFGCFGGTPAKGVNGQGYLADDSVTTNCDGGGAVDVFLVAGAPMDNRVPEPGSLALVGLALMGLGVARRRYMKH